MSEDENSDALRLLFQREENDMTWTEFTSDNFHSEGELAAALQDIELPKEPLPLLEDSLLACTVEAVNGVLHIRFTAREKKWGEMRSPPTPESIAPLPMLVELACHYTRIRYTFTAENSAMICQLLLEHLLRYDWMVAKITGPEVYQVALRVLPAKHQDKQLFLRKLAKPQDLPVVSA